MIFVLFCIAWRNFFIPWELSTGVKNNNNNKHICIAPQGRNFRGYLVHGAEDRTVEYTHNCM